MKKSLLALAVIAVAASANAATVYDKDGTKLTIDGRVQSVFYSGNHTGKNAGENDSTIRNSSRFGIGGKTQITDWVAGFGYSQWDTTDGGSNNNFNVRDQFVGADFGDFGKLQAGRYRDSVYYVENITDHYEDAADNLSGNFNGARRGGQLTYTYDNYGFHAQLGVQTAQDKAKVYSDKHGAIGIKDTFAVDSGFNLALGYTFDDVVFGPLSFRAGYNYMKGQDGRDLTTAGTNSFDKFKHAAGGVQWGNLSSGLFLGGLYDYAKIEGITPTNATGVLSDNDAKIKGFELIGGYAFDNGVSFLVGYESAKYEFTNRDDFKVKRIPVFVNYKLNPNFNIWTEAGFNAGSDHGKTPAGTAVSKSVDKTVFSIGARYTF